MDTVLAKSLDFLHRLLMQTNRLTVCGRRLMFSLDEQAQEKKYSFIIAVFVDNEEWFDSGSSMDCDRVHCSRHGSFAPVAFSSLYSDIISCINVISRGNNINADRDCG